MLKYDVSLSLKFQAKLYVSSYNYSQSFMQVRTEEIETTLCDSLYIITNSL